ncbi:MAG: Xaa-Pro peptidase family protein [Gammaproteobacteria bacterium]|nr:Xaa-Pro peptidase family protein [Gammaproteobacteria bacterium]MCZ6912756.1 Xaa-Pro peptidase family protein [Pseudomonadota bacterium]
MPISKREFLKISGLTAGIAGLSAAGLTACSSSPDSDDSHEGGKGLESITGDVRPISVDERLSRIAKAQLLMVDVGIDAIVLEPGSAMLYFSGVNWRRSERLTVVIIPRRGEIAVVTPYFEEPSVRESMTFGDDVRTWHEHENPFDHVAGMLKDRGINQGVIGLEDTVRYFVVEGLKKSARSFAITTALPVTLGCRMYKSDSEIALMKKASEVTLTAYGHVYPRLEAGMTPADVNAMMYEAQTALGGSNVWNAALFGEASAYPHGTSQPQEIKERQIVLMDCGCTVEGYKSDISRTFVFGKPTKRQREVWQTVRKGQQIAFETATLGTPAGAVDDAVRAHYESLGYGPGYRTPGLSHRTGHGIGMDGHESVNFVRGETTLLMSGMCFSNEPGIYIYGEFGVRLEDCIYMTLQGPAWFTVPPDSLDEPIGRMG